MRTGPRFFRCPKCLAGTIVVVSMFAEPVSAQAPTWTPEAATSLLRVLDQMRGIDSWELTTFKATAWRRIAELLAERKDAGLSLDELVSSSFAKVAESPLIATEQKSIKDELAKLDTPGPVSLSLSADTVEVLWTLRAIAPALATQLRDQMSTRGEIWYRGLTRDQFVREVEAALHRYETQQRRMAKVKLLLDLSDPLRSTLNIDSGRYRRWLDQELGKPQAPRTVVEWRTLESELGMELRRVKDWFAKADASLQAASQRALASLPREVMVPMGSNAFLRYRFQDSISGTSTRSADISLAIFRDGPAPAIAASVMPMTAAPPPGTEWTFDLAVHLDGIHLDANNRPQVAAMPSNAVTLRDQAVLTRSLVALGLPKEIVIEHIEILAARLTPDQMHFQLRARLPIGKQPVELAVSIVPGKLTVATDPSHALSLFARDELNRLQNQLLTNLRVAGTQLTSSLGRRVPIRDVTAQGDWSKGTLFLTAEVDAGSWGTWRVPLHFEKSGSAWQVRPGDAIVPVATRDIALARIRQYLAAQMAGNRIAALESYFRLTGIEYDPSTHALKGEVSFKCDLPSLPEELKVTFTAPLESGALQVDQAAFAALRNRLQEKLDALLADARAAAQGKVDAALQEQLRNARLDLAGLTLEIVSAKPLPGNRFDLSARLAGGSKQFSITHAVLLDTTGVVNGTVGAPKLDLSQVEITPGLDTLLSAITRLDQNLLRVSTPRRTPNGFSVTAELTVAGLTSPIPLGEIVLSQDGARWEVQALRTMLTRAAIDAFGTVPDLTVAGVGTLSSVTIDPNATSIENPLRFGVKGRMKLQGLFEMPVRITVLPSLSMKEDGDLGALAAGALDTGLKSVLPDGVAGFKFDPSPTFISSPPYGIEFGLKVNAWVFVIEGKGFRLTQERLEMPPTLTTRVTATIPIPPVFAIVNPGVGLPTQKGAPIEVVGDLTFVGNGVEKIFKLAITLRGSIESKKFGMEGHVVLLDTVQIFKIDGNADFDAGLAKTKAETEGLIDKIITVRADQTIDANQRLLTQDASLGLFGLQILKTPTTLQVLETDTHFATSAGVNIPIAPITISIEGTAPKLDDIVADADLEPTIGGFKLGGGHVHLTWSSAKLTFGVMGFNITIVAPSVNAITPQVVLDAIQRIFDVEFDLTQLLNRDIVINLVNGQQNPIGDFGEGDPVPTDQAAPAADNTAAGAPESRAAPPDGAPNAKPARTYRGESSGKPIPEDGGPRTVTGGSIDHLPSHAVTYKSGPNVLQFIPTSGANPSDVVIRRASGDDGLYVHYKVSQEVREHLQSPGTIILDMFDLPIVGNDRKQILCREGNVHDDRDIPVWLTLTRSGVSAAVFGASGTVVSLSGADDPSPLILQGTGALSLWQLIQGEKPGQPQYLQPGDMRMLEERARAQLLKEYANFRIGARVNIQPAAPAQELAASDGYFYQRVGADGKTTTAFLLRANALVIADTGHTSWLRPILRDQGKDAFFVTVLRRVILARMTGRVPFRAYASPTLDNVLLTLNRTAAHPEVQENPQQLLSLTRAAGSRLVTVVSSDERWDDLPFAPEPFRARVAELVAGTDDGSTLWIGESGGEWRAVFGRRLGGEWELTVVRSVIATAQAPATVLSHVIAGSVVADRYRMANAPKPSSPRALATEADRRWFLGQLTVQPSEWIKNLNVNPWPLVLPASQQ